MPRWTTREELILEIVRLDREGRSRRAIARAVGVSRNTVRKILDAHASAREQPHTALPDKPARAPRQRKIDAFVPQIDDLLEQFPDITAQRVFEELRAGKYSGGQTAVKDYVREVRPKPRPTPSFSTPDYGPAKMAESDWSPYEIRLRGGQKCHVEAFAYVLCHSRRKSFLLFERNDLHALMDGHVATFEHFGGAAEACKYDGQKAVVLGWEGRQPIYNPRFVAFATHYAFRPVACRPASPNEKPHVERAFWELERSFLNGRDFADLDDMRRQLEKWQRSICDQRIHRKLKRTPLDMFEEERTHLVTLPAHPYDTARVVYRLCDLEGFIAWNGNRYAVPYDHVTDLLPIRITQNEVFVYGADLALIAQHPLAPKSAGQDVGGSEHHRRRRQSAADIDQVRETFEDLGDGADDFFGALLDAQPRLAGHHGRQILLLRQRYNTEDICRALRHALSFGALDHKSVARILAARAAPRTLAEYVEEETARRLRENVGATAIPPRDLAEYDQLPVTVAEGPPQEEEWPSEPQTTSPPSSTDSEDTSKS